jgi:hypothetical protein
VDVGEIDECRHQIRIQFERSSIGSGRLLPRRLVAIVERRSSAEVFLGQRGIARRCRRWLCLLRRFFRPLKREDLRRRRVEPEVEGQLSPVGG